MMPSEALVFLLFLSFEASAAAKFQLVVEFSGTAEEKATVAKGAVPP